MKISRPRCSTSRRLPVVEAITWLEARDLALIFCGLAGVFGVGYLVGVNL